MDKLSEQVIQTLRKAIRALGFTTGQVERKLEMSPGYLSRMFSGKIEVKLRHVEEIANVLGLEPAELLSLSFPSEPGKRLSPAARRVREALGLEPAELKASPSREPAERDAASSDGEMEHMMLRTLRRLVAPPKPAVPSEDEMEEMMVRALRRFFHDEAGRQR